MIFAMSLSSVPTPRSLAVAVLGAAISGVALVVTGIATMAVRQAVISAGVGLMLVAYGVLVCLGAWAGHRRWSLARGLIVAPALLHILVAGSLFTAGDLKQDIVAALILLVSLVTLVAAVLPSTMRALGGRDEVVVTSGG